MHSSKGQVSHPVMCCRMQSTVRAYAQTAPLITRLSHPSTVVQLKTQYSENHKRSFISRGYAEKMNRSASPSNPLRY